MKQTRGMGRIYQRPGTDLWWIQYNIRGKKYRESSGSASQKDALALLRKRLSAAAAGKTPGPQPDRTTLAELLDILRNRYRAEKRRSLGRVEFAIVRLLTFFDPTERAINITTDRISAYRAERQDGGAAQATINAELAALRRAFNLALEAGKVASVPKISTPEPQNARKGFFEPAQYEAVAKHLPAHIRIVADVAHVTGWRTRSELLTRQWRHVDFDAGWLRLDPGESKNGEGREFPLTPELRALLEAQRERVSKIERTTGQIVPWVFPSTTGKRLLDIRWQWNRACRLAGLPDRLVHDLRRTAVRNLERAGVPRSAAMKLTGHKTESVYRRYAIVDATMLREAGAALEAFRAARASGTEKGTGGTVIALPVAKKS